MSGALSGIRVLDLSRVLAGPWCGQILADLGAEVIKVERPGAGDDTRGWGPPYLKDKDGKECTADSAYYLAANRNKKSLTLNLSKPEGQALVRELVKNSDVFIENYKVGDMKRYGLSYDDLKIINPRLIYCSITGFGQDGPLSSLAGYDFVVQGMGGLMSITGERDDLPGGGPQKVGVAFADIMTGMYATVAILAAINHRHSSGEGQYIDTALLDVQVAALANMNMNYLVSGNIPKRQGNAHANIVPYQVFDTKDGQMVLAVGNDSQFAKLCEILDHREWAADDRFKTNAGRVRNREIIISMLQSALSEKNVADWISPLEKAGVPCGAINNIAQTFAHPQVQHRGMKVELPHPLTANGSVPLVASPLKLSGSPVEYRMAPPTLGQHTHEILSDLLGMDAAQIQTLAEKGIV
ncbi:CaiB/BaiF CoA transferase family protein [Stenoxybacter acetivorans]|uniref:CaiB/BaiF CoA transferase family protein n=1 Tax=Stenoxybacter acetivorans TaxID=422441 RepID=UPI00056A8FFF|nr:CaiB/BaiF CoA-transferase family protein [Stenoxybacter acetivorans]